MIKKTKKQHKPAYKQQLSVFGDAMMIFYGHRLKGVKRLGANTVRIHKTNFQGSRGIMVWWDRLRLGLHRMSWIIFALEFFHLSAVTGAAVYFFALFSTVRSFCV